MDLVDLIDILFYNVDIMDKFVLVVCVFEQIGCVDVLVLVCFEYNYLLVLVLKNILDWVLCELNNVLLVGKFVVILGVGGGMGMLCVQYYLCQVCVYLDLYLLNKLEVFVNVFVGGFFVDGDFIDECIVGLIIEQMQVLVNWMLKYKV